MKPINISKKNMVKNITYHDNGNICEESFYKDGRRNGECTTAFILYTAWQWTESE